MNINDFKELEKVYGIPTGNNARYNNSEECVIFHIVQVKRVYIKMRQEGYKSTVNLDASGKSKDDWNAGYKFFPSLEALENYKFKKEKCKYIGDRFRFQNDFMRLSDECLDMIMEEVKK